MSDPDPRGGPTAHGAALGKALAEIADDGARLAANLRPRCGCCAFRLGSMPNQCASTVRDALDALCRNDTDFMCHHGLDADGEPTRPCAGYEAAKAAPFRWVGARLKAASAMMPGDDAFDPVRADYVSWLATADPDNRLDDYQRAALFAQRGDGL